MNDPRARAEAARDAVRQNATWYHTLELAPGIVTPGHVDMRGIAAKVLPDDLSGKRALDIGTFDGFWAFEMERRGAEVVAIDVEKIDDAEWPPVNREALLRETARYDIELGRGFRLAAEILESRARRVVCNLYDVSPERIGGEVDFVFSGSILLHLRDPVRALERVHGVLSAGGELRLMEPFSVALSLRSPRTPAATFNPLRTQFNWWVPNLAGLNAWLAAAAFERIERLAFLRPPSVKPMRQLYAAFSARPRPPVAGGHLRLDADAEEAAAATV